MCQARSSEVRDAPPEKEKRDVKESASTKTFGSVSAHFRLVLQVSGRAPVGASSATWRASTSHSVVMAAPGSPPTCSAMSWISWICCCRAIAWVSPLRLAAWSACWAAVTLLWRCMRSVCSCCCCVGGGPGVGACCGVGPPCRPILRPSRTWFTQGAGLGLPSPWGLALRRRVRPSQSGSVLSGRCSPPAGMWLLLLPCCACVVPHVCWGPPLLSCQGAGCQLSTGGASLPAWWWVCGCVSPLAWWVLPLS